MMMVRHILRDGTQADSIEGKVIKAQEFGVLYESIGRIRKNERHENDDAGRTDGKVLHERQSGL